MPSPTLAIIIPCYNEAARLPLRDFGIFLSSNKSDLHFLFVNDGSTDNTESLLTTLCGEFPRNTNLFSLPKNAGKGEAIRRGVNHILSNIPHADYVGFMDADLSTPLNEIEHIMECMEKYQRPSMLIGSRIKLYGTSSINRSSSRHYSGRFIATLISQSLGLAIYDTQCGFKFIRRDKLSYLFAEKFISRWLFDVELIFRLQQIIKSRDLTGELFEIPLLKWKEKGKSKIPLTFAFRIPFELLMMRMKYR